MYKPFVVAVICAFTINVVLARPASNELDNVSPDDTSVNVVDDIKRQDASTNPESDKNSASVQITGISTGIDSPSPSPGGNDTNFKPQRAGTMFARLIDDIFNIPITVLQSVAKLLTNPFTTKSPVPESH